MDLEPPPELREIVDLARTIGQAELHDAEIELDRIQDPLEAFTSDTHRKITRLMAEVGLTKLTIPAEWGGLGLGPLAKHLVEHELARCGAGLASQWLLTPLAAALIAAWNLANRHPVYRAYLESYAEDTTGAHSGAWTITEPDLGSDIFDPSISFGVRARRSSGGGAFVLHGAKSAWCTNGWLADMFCVMARVEEADGAAGTGTFLVPADWPGIRKGAPISKVGLRALNQTEICFDEVDVPAEFMIAPPGPGYEQVLDAFVTAGNTGVGNIAIGVARSAYELGLAYVRERRQGGKPLIEHQLVARKIFDAYRAIDGARLMLRRSATMIAEGRGRPEVAFAARVQACEAAARITADMMFLHGGNGITTEYPIEKLWRDVQPLQVMDGTVDRVALKGAERLARD